jgi:hypothetical protein
MVCCQNVGKSMDKHKYMIWEGFNGWWWKCPRRPGPAGPFPSFELAAQSIALYISEGK